MTARSRRDPADAIEFRILRWGMTLDVRWAQWRHKGPYEREAGGQSQRQGARTAEAGAEKTRLPRSWSTGHEPESGGRQPGKGPGAGPGGSSPADTLTWSRGADVGLRALEEREALNLGCFRHSVHGCYSSHRNITQPVTL